MLGGLRAGGQNKGGQGKAGSTGLNTGGGMTREEFAHGYEVGWCKGRAGVSLGRFGGTGGRSHPQMPELQRRSREPGGGP